MQVTGTFPELSSGMKKSRRNGKFAKGDPGPTGFAVSRMPRKVNAPKTLAGRREASHHKAYGKA